MYPIFYRLQDGYIPMDLLYREPQFGSDFKVRSRIGHKEHMTTRNHWPRAAEPARCTKWPEEGQTPMSTGGADEAFKVHVFVKVGSDLKSNGRWIVYGHESRNPEHNSSGFHVPTVWSPLNEPELPHGTKRSTYTN